MTVKVKGKNEDLSNEESRIQLFVNQMLASRMFIACYVGRFYVEHLKTYRDVLRIESEEKDIIKHLLEVKKRITHFYKGSIWSGITGPNANETPSGHCVWIRLNKSLPLGEAHWFLIERAAISDAGELVMRVKDVRNIKDDVKKSETPEEKNSSLDINKIKNDLTQRLEELITWHNTKESIKFLFVLLMTIVTVLLNSLQYLGDYSIRFFKEFNNFVKVSTPIFLAVIDLVKKSIGGFFILIAMMWGGSARAPPPPQQMGLQGHYQPYQRRLKYN